MDLSYLLKGVVLGFCIAAPVGPIGVLCIRKTFQFGRLSGLFSGLGAAFADTCYGAISAFGLTLIADSLIAQKFWIHLLGAIFLFILGAKTFLTNPPEKTEKITHKTLFGDFLSTFILTLANPLTILSFVAVFAALGIAANKASPLPLILGVFLGSMIWWSLLSEIVTLFRKKMSQKVLSLVNRIAGVLLMLFGLAAISLYQWL